MIFRVGGWEQFTLGHRANRRLVSDFGSEEGHLTQVATFDWIIAATGTGIEQGRVMEGLLGTRYIDLRWRTDNRMAPVVKAVENSENLDAIRKQCHDAMGLLLDAAQTTLAAGEFKPVVDRMWIADVADLTALCRTPVQRDRNHRVITMPEPELGTSIAQDFARIAQGLQFLGVLNYQEYLHGLASDCLPRLRSEVLRAASGWKVESEGDRVRIGVRAEQSASDIAKRAELPRSTVEDQLDDLHILGVTPQQFHSRLFMSAMNSTVRKQPPTGSFPDPDLVREQPVASLL